MTSDPRPAGSLPGLSIVEVFPPGRRREMVLRLAQRPEFDQPGWQGRVIFRCFRTHHEGKPGLAVKIEPDEETVL